MTPPWLPICVALSATSAVCYIMMGRVQAQKDARRSRQHASGEDASAGDFGASWDAGWADFGVSGSDSGGTCDTGDGGGGADCGGGD